MGAPPGGGRTRVAALRCTGRGFSAETTAGPWEAAHVWWPLVRSRPRPSRRPPATSRATSPSSTAASICDRHNYPTGPSWSSVAETRAIRSRWSWSTAAEPCTCHGAAQRQRAAAPLGPRPSRHCAPTSRDTRQARRVSSTEPERPSPADHDRPALPRPESACHQAPAVAARGPGTVRRVLRGGFDFDVSTEPVRGWRTSAPRRGRTGVPRQRAALARTGRARRPARFGRRSAVQLRRQARSIRNAGR
ncbi:hypothetical protein APR04_003075 [Promicromonospora umidemergens]|nr:hypothetical protein [Promicromonospora umidemergens]